MENTRVAVLSGHIRPRNLTAQSCADEGGDRDQIFSGHVDGIVFEGDNLLKKFQSSGRGTRSELLQVFSELLSDPEPVLISFQLYPPC